MGLFKSLFGKKAAAKNYDNGQDISVDILDPKGSYGTKWKVGEDVSKEVVDKLMDSTTNKLYAVIVYEEGKPKTNIIHHTQWLEVKAAMGE